MRGARCVGPADPRWYNAAVDAPPKLSVVMPVYNERLTLSEILERVQAVAIPKEIIVIDDGSTDGTRELLRSLEVELAEARRAGTFDEKNEIRILFQDRNQGKGAAVRRGFAEARGDIVLIQDADLEYDPREYPRLIGPIVDGRADAVFGSRFTGSPRRVLFFWHHIANKMLTLFSNAVTNLNLTDMETGYKAVRADFAKSIVIRSNRFGIEPELTAKLARMRARIYEVPISYSGRSYWEGKKIRWTDGVSALWTILKYGVLVDDQDNVDPGYQTLVRLSRAEKYNRWLFGQLAPHLGQRVLEIGAGIGTLTRYMAGRELVLATDINARYLRILANTFERHTRVEVQPLDLADFDPAALAALSPGHGRLRERAGAHRGRLPDAPAGLGGPRARRAPGAPGPRPPVALRGHRPGHQPLPAVRAARARVADGRGRVPGGAHHVLQSARHPRLVREQRADAPDPRAGIPGPSPELAGADAPRGIAPAPPVRHVADCGRPEARTGCR